MRILFQSRLAPASGQRGFLLIVVLGIVVGLSLIAYTMHFSVRTHSRIAGNSVADAQARALATAAVEQSIAVLATDETIVDGLEEVWQDTSFFEEMELDTGTY